MSLTVYFVRHGESQANTERVFANRPGHRAGLTPTGIEQAGELAALLRPLGITHIYSSSLLRARQTAEIVSMALNLPITASDALREYDVGDFEGLSYGGADAWRWEAYEQVVQAWQRGDRHACLQGGESLVDIEARFLPFMASLDAAHAISDRLVIVSHGGLYRVALPGLCRTLTAHDTRCLPVDHCAPIIVAREEREWRCLAWGGRRPPWT